MACGVGRPSHAACKGTRDDFRQLGHARIAAFPRGYERPRRRILWTGPSAKRQQKYQTRHNNSAEIAHGLGLCPNGIIGQGASDVGLVAPTSAKRRSPESQFGLAVA
jgi:hypothetical protein